jgi:hypothetical protein
VEQALVLLEENYVHLPLKRAMHAVDPVQRLRLLRHRLEDAREEDLGPEIEFHDEMTRIFNSLRDLHTTYRLPSPFKDKTAWLPFLIEEVVEQASRYLVTKVVANAGPTRSCLASRCCTGTARRSTAWSSRTPTGRLAATPPRAMHAGSTR